MKDTKNHMWLDASGLDGLLEDLEKAGADVKEITERALVKTADRIQKDVEKAMDKKHLPAKGKYSTGRTKRTILNNQRVEWDGDVARIPVGFDETKPGASFFLINGVWNRDGTSRMKPNWELDRIFRKGRYMSERKKEMAQFFKDELGRITGGGF